MLGTSPLSVTYSFGENYQGEQGEDMQYTEKILKKGRLSTILTEKIVNGKLEVQRYAVLGGGLLEEDKQRMLSFKDEILGWAYVNYKAYHTGIILFDGKATKVGEDMWQISTGYILDIRNGEFDPKFSEKYNNFEIMNDLDSEIDLNYKVIFSVKITETEHENILINSFIYELNSETSQNIRFSQIVDLTTNTEKSIVSNQDFRNLILD